MSDPTTTSGPPAPAPQPWPTQVWSDAATRGASPPGTIPLGTIPPGTVPPGLGLPERAGDVPAPRPRNRVLGALAVVLALIVVGYFSLLLVDLAGHTESTVRRTLPAVSRIELDIDGGSVTVITEDRDDVAILRRVREGLRKVRVSEVVMGDTLRIETNCPRLMGTICWVSHEVRVPPGVDVVGRSGGGSTTLVGVDGVTVSSGGGHIRLDSVNGPIDVRTGGGPIDARSLSTSLLKARTGGGPIEISFERAPEQVDVSTGGGPITLEVPRESPAYAVDASTGGGGTDIQVATDPAATTRITARSGGGPITIRYAG